MKSLDSLLNEVFDSATAGVVVFDGLGRVRAANEVWKMAAVVPVGARREPQRENGELISAFRNLAMGAAGQKSAVRQSVSAPLRVGESVYDTRILGSATSMSIGGTDFVVVVAQDLSSLCQSLPVSDHRGLHGLVGEDPRMLQLFDTIRQVGAVDVPVLIEGESGTGKELVAHALHAESQRRYQQMTIVNSAGLSPTLLESELFGHVKGAYTGATTERKGRFASAHGSTIFLDEIGDIPGSTQVKLLRVLQDGSFEPLGGDKTERTDARVVSATSRNLKRLARSGKYRSDLFYRLSVVLITLPPLRERRGDIPILTRHLLKKMAARYRIPCPGLSSNVMDLLEAHHWPGNVRELESALSHAAVRAEGEMVTAEHLPRSILMGGEEATPLAVKPRRRLTEAQVERALRYTGGNKAQAARLLGVARATLYRFFARRDAEARAGKQDPASARAAESH